MIITAEEFLNLGYHVSSDNIEAVDLAIEQAEMFSLKPMLGDEVMLALSTATEPGTKYYHVKHGGIIDGKILPGVKYAIAHLVFSFLLTDNIAATRFGAVKKHDEESTPATIEDIKGLALHHDEVFRQYMRDTCDFLGIPYKSPTTNIYEY